jgi:type IV secretion system protein VirD4
MSAHDQPRHDRDRDQREPDERHQHQDQHKPAPVTTRGAGVPARDSGPDGDVEMHTSPAQTGKERSPMVNRSQDDAPTGRHTPPESRPEVPFLGKEERGGPPGLRVPSGPQQRDRRLGRWMPRVRRRPGAVRGLTFNAVRMAHRWAWRPGLAGIGTAAFGWLVTAAGWPHLGHRLSAAGSLMVVAVTAWWWTRHVARPHTTKALIKRRAELDQRCGGVATVLDIAEHAGPAALRLKAPVLRPTTRDLSRWARRRLDPAELGVLVATTGWGLWGQQVWSSCEDATLRIGGPRVGKTVSLACHAEDAPGALVTTSTRLDLAEMVHATRSGREAVHVFNPAGLGGLPSTLRWRVLAGCEDFATAQRRAADLIPPSTGEAERWDTQARRILALLLHAAAASGRSMRDVVRWAGDSSPTVQEEITQALVNPTTGAGEGARDRVTAMRGFWATNERTRTSITTTMSIPLAWMSDDRARLLGDADADDPNLIDITELIERGQTLHLIGHEDHTSLSPLIAALVAEIAHAARTLAADRPGGRLDPPLTLVLDEAAIAAPVPLDRWTADMGGRGVTIHISVQSLAQLRERWGDDPAAAILANVATFLVFGGSPTAADLRDISSLTGEHRMRVVGADHNTDSEDDGEQRGEHRWVPVLSPAQIRALDPGQVLVMRRGLHTLLGWAPQIQHRPGWQHTPLTGLTAHVAPSGERIPSAAELQAMVETPAAPFRARIRRVASNVATRLRSRRATAADPENAGEKR